MSDPRDVKSASPPPLSPAPPLPSPPRPRIQAVMSTTLSCRLASFRPHAREFISRRASALSASPCPFIWLASPSARTAMRPVSSFACSSSARYAFSSPTVFSAGSRRRVPRSGRGGSSCTTRSIAAANVRFSAAASSAAAMSSRILLISASSSTARSYRSAGSRGTSAAASRGGSRCRWLAVTSWYAARSNRPATMRATSATRARCS